MGLQNRVTPFGEIVAADWRGGWMGNRGCLHDAAGRIGRARWRGKAWICCRLAFRGRWRPPMPPKGAPTRYTALFFWDEVTALAAGHRPCGECRRADLGRFRAAWAAAGLPGRRAAEIDACLHGARLTPERRPQRPGCRPDALPEGAMAEPAAVPGTAVLRWDGRWLAWADPGYREIPAPAGPARLLTPEPIVRALAAGYRPELRRTPGER
ncbi:hypothetical protein LNKW23_12830 [Paralimibaculum aggregatum]|uniref:Uncharacterized protein n=1 Tax=Paralimibaculum aggregatum TaxID=3036245 RepID=A0ABQ6LIL6_9RHOB|nr:hypothetical protein [Limibaculum sp. NKW23]GMG82070.1 hypothetical protein LNKW23_12830 [Limibaculum sp. NKW23]